MNNLMFKKFEVNITRKDLEEFIKYLSSLKHRSFPILDSKPISEMIRKDVDQEIIVEEY